MKEKTEVSKTTPKLLRHFAGSPRMLFEGKIVLTNPEKWDDKTDVRLMREYAKATGKAVRAMCLMGNSERVQDSIHHWNSYAVGLLGCRIDFNYSALTEFLEKENCILQSVQYYGKSDVESQTTQFTVDDWPFIKRNAYDAEKEWRILWTGALDAKQNKELVLPTTLVQEVAFRSQLPESIFQIFKQEIQKRFGKIQVSHSWIYRHEDFEEAVSKKSTQHFLPEPRDNP
jgi:hypothetical protein